MAKLIHTMIRVRNLDRSLAFYRSAFGLTENHRLDFPEFALVYLKNTENDFEVELTWNKGRESAYGHGDGYGHLAVAVTGLEEERARFARSGFDPTPVKEFRDGDVLLAKYFFVQDPDGYKIEVLEKSGHYI